MRIALVVVAMTSTATADVTPLSALPLHEVVDTKDLHVPDDVLTGGETKYHSFDYQVAKPFCGVNVITDDWVAGASDLDDGWRTHEVWGNKQAPEFGLERIVERDGRAWLDRYGINGLGELTVMAHGRIPLHVVGHAGDTTVYAFRHLDVVTVVIGGVATAQIRLDSTAFQTGRGPTRSNDCPVAVTQVRIGGATSQLAQIVATLAAGSCVRVDASLSKTSRDPEAILAINARTERCH